MSALIPVVTSTVVAATPLIYAALGETIVEKAGMLNLGVEGMMLVGAVAGFAVGLGSGSLALGFVAAALAGMAMSSCPSARQRPRRRPRRVPPLGPRPG